MFFLLVHNNNINFIILNRHNYTIMENLGNPYRLLQDSPIVYFLFIYFYVFYQVWTPYAA